MHFRKQACALLAAVALVPAATRTVGAEDCPTAKSAASGYIVEREVRSKTEVLFGEGPVVRTVMRHDDKVILERTQFQGLFDLDRLDRGRRVVFKPKSDLAALFPLKAGKTATVEFEVEGAGRPPTSTIRISVKGTDTLYIGRCKYRVLKIERSESRGGGPFAQYPTDYYSSELKLILAKEHRDGKLIKFDRIYPIRR